MIWRFTFVVEVFLLDSGNSGVFNLGGFQNFLLDFDTGNFN